MITKYEIQYVKQPKLEGRYILHFVFLRKVLSWHAVVLHFTTGALDVKEPGGKRGRPLPLHALAPSLVVTMSRVNLLINWKWLRYPRTRSERALYLEKISPLGLATMVQLFKGWIELSNGLTITLGFQNLSTLSTTGARAVFFHLCFPVHYCSFLLKTNATYSQQLLQMCANSTASQPRRSISNVR